jgi:transketolase
MSYEAENLCSRGAYDIGPSATNAKAVIFASGSEVEIALAAKATLDQSGVPTRVVSVPCLELFDQQPSDYRDKIMGAEPVRVAVEAGVRLGWDRFIGTDGAFIGMKGFGASGPGEKVYEYFGITPAAVVEAVQAKA